MSGKLDPSVKRAARGGCTLLIMHTELAPTLIEEVDTRLRNTTHWVSDFDGVMKMHGLQLKDGRLDIESLLPEERQIIEEYTDALVDDGVAHTVLTGKSFTIIEPIRFMYQRTMEKMVDRGRADVVRTVNPHTGVTHEQIVPKPEWIDPQNGRVFTYDHEGNKRYLFLIAAFDNGGTWFDLFSPTDHAVTKEFDESFLERLTDPEVTTLLATAVGPEKRAQLARVNEVYSPLTKNPLWREARAQTKDFLYASPYGSKFNSVFDVEHIAQTPDIQQQWRDKTGVTITNHASFGQALRVLFYGSKVNILQFKVAEHIGFDFTPEGVTKEHSRWNIEDYMNTVYEEARIQAPDFRHVAIDDGVYEGSAGRSITFDGNGGFTPTSASKYEPKPNGWPISIELLLPQTREQNLVQRSLAFAQLAKRVRRARTIGAHLDSLVA